MIVRKFPCASVIDVGCTWSGVAPIVEYVIADSDRAILATDYFKRGSERAYKRMSMPRARIVSGERCAVPTIIRIEDDQRGTRTELVISELRTDAPIDDALFTTAALETRRDGPGIGDRR